MILVSYSVLGIKPTCSIAITYSISRYTDYLATAPGLAEIVIGPYSNCISDKLVSFFVCSLSADAVVKMKVTKQQNGGLSNPLDSLHDDDYIVASPTDAANAIFKILFGPTDDKKDEEDSNTEYLPGFYEDWLGNTQVDITYKAPQKDDFATANAPEEYTENRDGGDPSTADDPAIVVDDVTSEPEGNGPPEPNTGTAGPSVGTPSSENGPDGSLSSSSGESSEASGTSSSNTLDSSSSTNTDGSSSSSNTGNGSSGSSGSNTGNSETETSPFTPADWHSPGGSATAGIDHEVHRSQTEATSTIITTGSSSRTDSSTDQDSISSSSSALETNPSTATGADDATPAAVGAPGAAVPKVGPNDIDLTLSEETLIGRPVNEDNADSSGRSAAAETAGKSGLSVGASVGIAIGVFVFTLLVVAAGYALYRHKKAGKAGASAAERDVENRSRASSSAGVAAAKIAASPKASAPVATSTAPTAAAAVAVAAAAVTAAVAVVSPEAAAQNPTLDATEQVMADDITAAPGTVPDAASQPALDLI